MKITKTILILFLGILIIPIFSIIVLSFQNNNGNVFKWYQSILVNEEFTSAFLLSAFVSFLIAIFSVFFSFLLSLSWFNKRQLFVVLTLILIVGLLPPDIFALGINKVSQLLGFYSSNFFFLILGLTFYTLPFGILLFWTRFYFIEHTTLIAAKDIGLQRFHIVTKIILPLSKATTTTVFLLSFLLAFNEHPRTYYLSGSNVLLSEFLNGKLNSGADESIYAGGSITIILTAVLIVVYFVFQYISQRRQSYT
ncbi:MAG: ABC transporter permease subunit [Bacteroidetes bacterium]|nr:ABC transporter permease subunit [Bacteroidota bacterium]